MPRPGRRVPDTLVGQLRWHVAHCGQSLYRLAQETGIDQGRLSRFVRGERGLSMDAIDIVGKHLGLRLVRDED